MNASTAATMNGVDIARVADLAAKIKAEPHAAATSWSAEVTWTGGFRSEAKVRDFEPSRSDEPNQLGGTDTAPNPVEQVLGALGNCLAVGYAANATAAGVEIKDMTIRVEGDLDLHAFLGLADGNAGFSGISVSVSLDCNASDEALQASHEKVIGTSPVGHTLSRAVPVDVRPA